MIFVLKRPTGPGGYTTYFMAQSADDGSPETSTNLQDAAIYRATIDDGKVTVEPTLPPGNWEMVGVKLYISTEALLTQD